MVEDKYTVTFRMAQMGDLYLEKNELKESDAGHLWYVLRKNGEVVQSAGFHSKYSQINGVGEITPDDERVVI